jgi:hypothetical protein
VHRSRAPTSLGHPGVRRIDDGVARREERKNSGAERAGVDVLGGPLSGAVAQPAGLVVVAAVDDHAVWRGRIDAQGELMAPGRVERGRGQLAHPRIVAFGQRRRVPARSIRARLLRIGVSRVCGRVV